MIADTRSLIDLILRFCRDNKISRRRFAEMCGVNYGTLRHMEKAGGGNASNLLSMLRVLRGYGVDINALLSGEIVYDAGSLFSSEDNDADLSRFIV